MTLKQTETTTSSSQDPEKEIAVQDVVNKTSENMSVDCQNERKPWTKQRRVDMILTSAKERTTLPEPARNIRKRTKQPYSVQLTPKQIKFVRNYCGISNCVGADAARRAGYKSGEGLHVIVSRMLRHPLIQQAILEEMECNKAAIERDIRAISKEETAGYANRLKALELSGKIQGLFNNDMSSINTAIFASITDKVADQMRTIDPTIDISDA